MTRPIRPGIKHSRARFLACLLASILPGIILPAFILPGLMLAGLILTESAAFAAESAPPSLSVYLYKQLNEAQTLLEKNNTENARTLLEKLSQQADNSNYENGLVWNMLGYLHYRNGKLKPSEQAYEKALQFELPAQLAQDTRKTLAQVYMSDGDCERAVSHFNQWLNRAKTDTEDVHGWLAQCQYELKQYASAASHLQIAIAAYRARQQRPKEEWLSLLQASLAQIDDVAKRIDTLKLLLNWYPKAEYWLALASAYGQLNNMDNYLATLALAQRKDLLKTESQYLSLAGVYYSREVPLLAAQIVAEGLQRNIVQSNAKNLRFLASCYSVAQEFELALAPLQQAAAKSTTGDTDALLGNAYFQLARWQLAADAFEAGISKGELRQRTTIWLLLGQSYLNLHQFDRALYAFRQAALDEKHAHQAEQWIKYADFERHRYEELGLLKTAPPPARNKSS